MDHWQRAGWRDVGAKALKYAQAGSRTVSVSSSRLWRAPTEWSDLILVHDGPLVHWQEALRRGWAVSEGAVRLLVSPRPMF